MAEEDDAFMPVTMKKKKKNPLPPGPVAGGGGDVHREEAEGEGEGEDVLAWLSMDEDTVDELMKFLDDDQEAFSTTTNNNSNCDVNGDSSMRVKFIENPYSATLVFQSSSSYITINGNEETCGSSFSDWEASVMASIDMCNVAAAGRGGGTRGMLEEVGGEKGGVGGREMVEDGFLEEGLLMDGCDELLVDWDGDGLV